MREKVIADRPTSEGSASSGDMVHSEVRVFEDEPRWPEGRYIAEDIVSTLRQVEVLCGQNDALTQAVRAICATEVTRYR